MERKRIYQSVYCKAVLSQMNLRESSHLFRESAQLERRGIQVRKRNRLYNRYTKEDTKRKIKKYLKIAISVYERPIPVHRATYPAKQTGHFGMNKIKAPEKNTPKAPIKRASKADCFRDDLERSDFEQPQNRDAIAV